MSFDHRVTYAKAAAVHAIGALARLMDCGEPKELPTLRQLSVAELVDEAGSAHGGVAVFADLMGAVCGQAGLLLSGQAAGELLLELLGERPEGELPEPAASALCEAGNIAVSAASGALGHLVGGVVIPSVPRLGGGIAEVLNPDGAPPAGEPDPRHAYLVESQLGDPDSGLVIVFVWIPAPA